MRLNNGCRIGRTPKITLVDSMVSQQFETCCPKFLAKPGMEDKDEPYTEGVRSSPFVPLSPDLLETVVIGGYELCTREFLEAAHHAITICSACEDALEPRVFTHHDRGRYVALILPENLRPDPTARNEY